jgi:hypothetical protein
MVAPCRLVKAMIKNRSIREQAEKCETMVTVAAESGVEELSILETSQA